MAKAKSSAAPAKKSTAPAKKSTAPDRSLPETLPNEKMKLILNAFGIPFDQDADRITLYDLIEEHYDKDDDEHYHILSASLGVQRSC